MGVPCSRGPSPPVVAGRAAGGGGEGALPTGGRSSVSPGPRPPSRGGSQATVPAVHGSPVPGLGEVRVVLKEGKGGDMGRDPGGRLVAPRSKASSSSPSSSSSPHSSSSSSDSSLAPGRRGGGVWLWLSSPPGRLPGAAGVFVPPTEAGGQGQLGSPMSGCLAGASSSGKKLTRRFPGACSEGGGRERLGQGAGDSPSAPSFSVPGASEAGRRVLMGGSAGLLRGGGVQCPAPARSGSGSS